MKLTNKDVQLAFKRFNKMYFDNELPKDITVRFDTNGELDDDTYGLYIAEDKEILLHEDLCRIPDYCFIVELHEMAHIKAPDNAHGFQFGAVINMLWQKGAYDALV